MANDMQKIWDACSGGILDFYGEDLNKPTGEKLRHLWGNLALWKNNENEIRVVEMERFSPNQFKGMTFDDVQAK